MTATGLRLLAAAALALAAAAAAAQGPGYDPLRRPGGFNPLAPGAAPAPEGEAPTGETFEGLPVSPGVEETFYACTACHSAQTFTQQRLARARWDYLLTWMVEDQGMPELPPEDRALILDYLVRHFGAAV